MCSHWRSLREFCILRTRFRLWLAVGEPAGNTERGSRTIIFACEDEVPHPSKYWLFHEAFFKTDASWKWNNQYFLGSLVWLKRSQTRDPRKYSLRTYRRSQAPQYVANEDISPPHFKSYWGEIALRKFASFKKELDVFWTALRIFE